MCFLSYNRSMQVSIITINYNSSIHTIKLINSILKNISSAISYEIIIVDNASHNDDYDNLIKNIPQNKRIKIYKSNINTGFAGGNMHGYKQSSGKYILFINNDCECLNDIITPLLHFIQRNKSVGLLTGKVMGKDGLANGAHKLFPCLLKSILGNEACRFFLKNKFVSPKKTLKHPIKVQVVSGAFMFFESHIFKLIGGLDTKFFLDCEEEDISRRIWNFGKEIYIVPESEVIHEHGGSKDSSNDISNEYYISYKKLMFKHYNFPYAILMMVFIYLKILKDIFKMKSNMKLIKIALCGFNERFSLRYKQKSK